ncbi:MAG: hypothetical protein WKF94_02025 [Solirubrobacteraceae bacterium]
MQRRTKITAIVFGVFVFLGMSLLLARSLVGTGDERALVVDILEAQASGDAEAVLAGLPRCARDPVCSQVTTERTERLARDGEVEILNYDPSTQAAFTDQTGFARVAWRTESVRFPVVQCLVVRRQGPLTGGGVALISISNPIGLEADCAP